MEELKTGRRLGTVKRREQLLAAGAELLGRRPYDEVSLEEIAAAAGVSKSLLYHYFPTKTDYLLASLERGPGDEQPECSRVGFSGPVAMCTSRRLIGSSSQPAV